LVPLRNFIVFGLRNFAELVKKFFLFLLLGIGFIAFAIVNGGVVVGKLYRMVELNDPGDKEAHAPVFNFGQFLYFLGFTFALHLGPHIVTEFVEHFVFKRPGRRISSYLTFPSRISLSNILALVALHLACLLLIRAYR
jgi:Na+/proline symporter